MVVVVYIGTFFCCNVTYGVTLFAIYLNRKYANVLLKILVLYV